jgi:small subunit ribosomal protein S17
VTNKKKVRNVGLNIKPPTEKCTDENCPFHGILPIRGQIIQGTVASTKMKGTISVKKDYMQYIKKYERYETRTSKYLAHNPPCLRLKVGDEVRIAECRPLSKLVSFVAIEKL